MGDYVGTDALENMEHQGSSIHGGRRRRRRTRGRTRSRKMRMTKGMRRRRKSRRH